MFKRNARNQNYQVPGQRRDISSAWRAAQLTPKISATGADLRPSARLVRTRNRNGSAQYLTLPVLALTRYGSGIVGRSAVFWMKHAKSFMGQRTVNGVGAPSDRGARIKGAIDHQEQSKIDTTHGPWQRLA
jgi:hypothetical protein